MLRKLPAFALIAAPLLGVFCALGLYYSDRLDDSALKYHADFFLFNGTLALILNWRLLSEAGAQHKAWAGILLWLVFTTLCDFYIQQQFQTLCEDTYFHYTPVPTLLLSLVMQTGALLLATFCEKSPQRPADIALAVCANRFIFNGLLYGLFAGFTILIFGLGFALLRLVNIDLWQLLGEPGQQILIGLCGGLNLLILNLAPLPERERPFPYIYIFQYIALTFALFYLVILPFASAHIDSGQRLTIAAVFWLLAIWLYDREQPRRWTNLLTAAVGTILALLSLRGITVRINAYGLSEERAYALFLALALLLAHGGLLLKILALNRQTAVAQRAFTTTIALLATCTLITALLPLPRWVLVSQVARYTTGGADPAELAENYLFNRYGKAGKHALAEIRTWHGDSAAVAALKEAELSPEEKNAKAQERFRAALQTFPTDYQPDDTLLAAAYEASHEGFPTALLQTDADHDGTPEILLLGWDSDKQCHVHRYNSGQHRFDHLGYRECGTVAALRQHGIHYERPRYDDLIIGDLRLKLND